MDPNHVFGEGWGVSFLSPHKRRRVVFERAFASMCWLTVGSNRGIYIADRLESTDCGFGFAPLTIWLFDYLTIWPQIRVTPVTSPLHYN